MDDEEPRKTSQHEVGMMLDTLSIDELESRIALLEGEIERLRAAIAAKKDSKSAADAVFKF